MVLDASRFSTSTARLAAAPAGVTTADPWDAPYFGGPVYFDYRPTLATMTGAHTGGAVRASDDAARVAETKMETIGALAADPWDAPYFGGPVYFDYRPGGFVSVSEAEKPAVAVGTSVSFVFSPWDAPYFGGPVYFGYADSAVKVFDLAAIETTEAGGGEEALAAISSEMGTVLAAIGAQDGNGEKQRGWLARFFRRELYIGRRG